MDLLGTLAAAGHALQIILSFDRLGFLVFGVIVDSRSVCCQESAA